MMLTGVMVGGFLAHGKPPIERIVHVDATPDVLYELLTDLQGWGEWAEVGIRDEGPHVSVRGPPHTREQELRWAGRGLGAGRIRTTDVHDDHIGFDVIRTTPAGFGVDTWTRWRQSTEISWAASDDGGSSLRWATRVRNATANSRNVLATIDQALAALKAAAEEELSPPGRPAIATTTVEALALWRGIEHEWTYNHRINRLGSWVSPPQCAGSKCTAELVHAAATGAGADEASFVRRASLVTAPGLEANYGTTTLWFTGREGQALLDSHCWEVPNARSGGTAILSGFDIDALHSPHSLWGLGVEVSSERVEGHQILCVDGRVQMACRTPDCRRDRWTEYALEVHWVYVTAPGLRGTALDDIGVELEWRADDLRDMLHPADHSVEHTLVGVPGLQFGTAALSAIDVQLQQPRHTRGLTLSLVPGSYDATTGELEVDLTLFYQQWGPVEIAPLTLAQFSRPGRAELAADLVLLQLPRACTTERTVQGRLYWPGKNREASGPDAEASLEVHFGEPHCHASSPDGVK